MRAEVGTCLNHFGTIAFQVTHQQEQQDFVRLLATAHPSVATNRGASGLIVVLRAEQKVCVARLKLDVAYPLVQAAVRSAKTSRKLL
eukprot:866382-Pleurochrysis_carterae.AAC.2